MIQETSLPATPETSDCAEFHRKAVTLAVASVRRVAGNNQVCATWTFRNSVLFPHLQSYVLSKNHSLQRMEKKIQTRVCCGFIYPQIIIALNLPFCFNSLNVDMSSVSLFPPL
jgi:ABC-type spermidine/putrescine transport system permease subunit II